MRHGVYEQPDGVPSAYLPHPLTAEGRGQSTASASGLLTMAEELGLALDPVIDTSGLLRAWETGSLIAEELRGETGDDFRVESFDALNERCVGSMANLSVSEIADVVARDPRLAPLPDGWKSTSDFRLPFPGAESMLDAGRRCAHHVDERLAALSAGAERDSLKLFVGHGGAFRHAANHLGVLDLADIPKLSMHYCGAICFERTNDGHYVHLAGAWKVRGAKARVD
jgi:2,3-bisphosphoglycerate-dependent phosphoglycerate mutase